GLGITAIEIMPVAEFPGSRNWGYDGVHLYAPQSTYGGPRGLRRLVDAAHGQGLSVFLDVVYNHLGPEGNYLGEFGPYFTDRYKTPWGSAINFDGPDAEGVRRHFVDNARYWVREFHVDGLRLDAIHSIFDASPVHVLTELADAAREAGQALDRPGHTPRADLGGERFTICLQNHDQVGNRAVGERLSTIAPFAAVKVAAALLFSAPALPLLFMGEEYGETSPFQYFTSHLDPALVEAVRKGRTEEFRSFGWEGAVPDPSEPATFLRSRLNHSLAGAPR